MKIKHRRIHTRQAPKGGAPKGGAPTPEKWGPEGWGPRRVGGPEGWARRVGPQRVGGPKFRACFFLSHHHFALFVSLWVSSRSILVVFEVPGTLKCARLEFSGCRVKCWRPRSCRGFTPQPETPNVHICPSLHKNHQNSTRRHPERHKKSEMVAVEGKKEQNFGRSGRGGSRGVQANNHNNHNHNNAKPRISGLWGLGFLGSENLAKTVKH